MILDPSTEQFAVLEGRALYAGHIVTARVTSTAPLHVQVTIDNMGTEPVISTGACMVIDHATGEPASIMTLNSARKTIKPGELTCITETWASNLHPGRYLVSVVFPFPDSEHTISKSFEVTVQG